MDVDAAVYCDNDFCERDSLCFGCRVPEDQHDCEGCQSLVYPKLLGEKGRLSEENETLSKENKHLRDENEELRNKLSLLGEKYRKNVPKWA